MNKDLKILLLKDAAAGKKGNKDAKNCDHKSSLTIEAKCPIDSLNSNEGDSSPIVNPINNQVKH